MPRQNTIQLRKGTLAQWTSNNTEILASGEPGFETDTLRLKIGNGTTAWSALNYVGLAGTGTSGYLPKFNSSQGVTNSLIFDNGTNVGIGTGVQATTPPEKLTVDGNIRVADTAVTQGKVIQFTRGGGDQYDYTIGRYGLALAISVANDAQTHRPFQVGYHSGVTFLPKFHINGYTGDVGIGTTTPSQALQIGPTTPTGATPYALINGLRLSGGDTNNTIWNAGRNISITRDTGGKIHICRTSAPTIGITVDTTTGNVGIGTDTPSYKLNVNPASNSNNGIQILNNSAGTSARSLLSLFNGSHGAEISVGGTSFISDGFYRQNRLLISGPFITDYVTGQHIFSIGGGGTAQAVAGSTSVGLWDINALTVHNELRPTVGIAGGTLVGSSLTLKSTTNVGTTDHIKLVVGNNGATEAVRVINNGNVGIGTATPDAKLVVNGDAYTVGRLGVGSACRSNLSSDLGTTAGLSWNEGSFIGMQFSNTDTYRMGLTLWAANRETRVQTKTGDNTGKITFYPGAGTTEAGRFNSNGYFGIGTTSPESSLTINTTIGSSSNINSTAGYAFGIHHSGMRITSPEDTSTNPNYPLINLLVSRPGAHQGGTASIDFDSRDRGNAINRGIMARILGGNMYNTAANTSGGGYLSLEVAPTGSTTPISRIAIINNGNVGIGTTTPSYKLQVNGSFAASTKSFRIDHPSKKDHSLEYGSLESPYHGVRLTGRGKVIKGVGVVSLPDYLKDLIHDDDTLNIQITNIKHGKIIYIDKIDLKNDQFTVRVDRAKSLGDLEFFWVFTGVRKDVDRLVVEREK